MGAGPGWCADRLVHFGAGLIISIIIEALINFISAMVWPLYWMKRIDTDQTRVWFIVAYAGYWAGLKCIKLNWER